MQQSVPNKCSLARHPPVHECQLGGSQPGLRLLEKLAVNERDRTTIGMMILERLLFCEESLRVSWWRIFSQFDPAVVLPANHKTPDWTDVQLSLAWDCSKGLISHRDWRDYRKDRGNEKSELVGSEERSVAQASLPVV